MTVHGPDEDDVIEQGGPPLRPAPPAAVRTAPGVDLFGLAQTGERPYKN